MIALECCVDFCRMTARICHNHVYIPSLPVSHRAGWAPRIAEELPTSDLLRTWKCMSGLLSQLVLISPSLSVTQVPSLSASLSLPCRCVRQYCFSRFHTYVLIDDICFSPSDLLHSA